MLWRLLRSARNDGLSVCGVCSWNEPAEYEPAGLDLLTCANTIFDTFRYWLRAFFGVRGAQGDSVSIKMNKEERCKRAPSPKVRVGSGWGW